MYAMCESCTIKQKTSHFIQSIFYLCQIAWKTKRLVLVATAGSATTGPLELPALGADVGPRREIHLLEDGITNIRIIQLYIYN